MSDLDTLLVQQLRALEEQVAKLKKKLKKGFASRDSKRSKTDDYDEEERLQRTLRKFQGEIDAIKNILSFRQIDITSYTNDSSSRILPIEINNKLRYTKVDKKDFTDELDVTGTVNIDIGEIMMSDDVKSIMKARDAGKKAMKILDREIVKWFGSTNADIELYVDSPSRYTQVIMAMLINYFDLPETVEESRKNAIQYMQSITHYGDPCETDLFEQIHSACKKNKIANSQRTFTLVMRGFDQKRLYVPITRNEIPFERGVHKWVFEDNDASQIPGSYEYSLHGLLETFVSKKNAVLKVTGGSIPLNGYLNQEFQESILKYYNAAVLGTGVDRCNVVMDAVIQVKGRGLETVEKYLDYPWKRVRLVFEGSLNKDTREPNVNNLEYLTSSIIEKLKKQKSVRFLVVRRGPVTEHLKTNKTKLEPVFRRAYGDFIDQVKIENQYAGDPRNGV